jgi:hypothetical protein
VAGGSSISGYSTATPNNTASTIVARDGNGNFWANNITSNMANCGFVTITANYNYSKYYDYVLNTSGQSVYVAGTIGFGYGSINSGGILFDLQPINFYNSQTSSVISGYIGDFIITAGNYRTARYSPSSNPYNWTVTYFTGQHRSVPENIDILNNNEKYVGLICISTGKYNTILDTVTKFNGEDSITVNDCMPIVNLSTQKNQPSVYGVISDKEDSGSDTKKYWYRCMGKYNSKTFR